MDIIVPPRRKSQNKDKYQLRKMVRSFVTNLDNFQDELLVVLDDMKDLVGQIDDVSNKLDKQFGNKSRSEDILRSHSFTDVDIFPTEHHYVNIDLRPTIQNIEEKINLKLCSKERNSDDNQFQKCNNECFRVQEIKYKAIRPNSFDKDLDRPKQEDKINTIDNHHKPDHLLDSLESPMLDLSYLGINQTDNRPPRWGRSISLPIGVKSQVISQQNSPILRNEVIMKKNTSQEIAEKVRTPTAICFAELKRHYVPKRNMCSSISDEVFNDTAIKTSTPTTGTTVKTLTSSSMISNVSVDGDLYERKLDNELENMFETSDDSLMIESSDDSMETGSNAHTETFSDNIEGRYDINTWTLFTLNHMTDSTKSSESFVSDTPSDIMNDNIWPPSNVGDIFSNSMLARKLDKHLDNDFCSLHADVKH